MNKQSQLSYELPAGLSDLEKQLARENTGKFAWPTVVLALVNFMVFAFVTYQCAIGHWPLYVGLVLNAILAFVAFTPQHDAMHGAISGKTGSSNNISAWDFSVGWLCTLLLALPFSSYRLVHLRHHTHTNNPEMDVDYYTHTSNGFFALFGIYRQLIKGRKILKALLQSNEDYKKHLALSLLWLVVSFGFVGVCIYFGYAAEVLLLWVIPSQIALSFLSLLFQWLPHHPHTVEGRYVDTRATLFPGGTILLLGQNTHVIHHMFPRIPFYRYWPVFKQLRPELEARGTEIVGQGW